MHRPAGTVSLERALSKLGLASRTEARKLIEAGRVTVNGQVTRDPLRPVTPEKIQLAIDGVAPAKASWRTILLNKPRGVVTTRRDEQGRKTIYDALVGVTDTVMPVGRLDLATSGLLLLTNDHQLATYLTDPASGIVRTYVVTVKGFLTDVTPLTRGVQDEGELLRAHSVTVRKSSQRETHLVIALDEGKNREIRRLCKAVGHEVTKLKRISFGPLELGALEAGQWRDVTREEIQKCFPNAPARGPLHN